MPGTLWRKHLLKGSVWRKGPQIGGALDGQFSHRISRDLIQVDSIFWISDTNVGFQDVQWVSLITSHDSLWKNTKFHGIQ